MLVGSNPTEGGGFFPRKEPPRAMDVLYISSGLDGRVVEGRINTLWTTTGEDSSPVGKGAHGSINVVVYVVNVRWNGRIT
jgi:hypothetical protein